jgi:hypothetical protein
MVPLSGKAPVFIADRSEKNSVKRLIAMLDCAGTPVKIERFVSRKAQIFAGASRVLLALRASLSRGPEMPPKLMALAVNKTGSWSRRTVD